MTNRITSKRQAANTSFSSINAALIIGLLGYFGTINPSQPDNSFGYVIPMFITAWGALILNYLWYIIILSYRSQEAVKFKIIHEIEKHLPLRLHDVEWRVAIKRKDPKLYVPFGAIEAIIPLIFVVAFFLSYAWGVVSIFKHTG